MAFMDPGQNPTIFIISKNQGGVMSRILIIEWCYVQWGFVLWGFVQWGFVRLPAFILSIITFHPLCLFLSVYNV